MVAPNAGAITEFRDCVDEMDTELIALAVQRSYVGRQTVIAPGTRISQMFDAKSLIEMMMKGAAQPQAQQGGGGDGGLADILGKMMGGGGQGQGAPAGQQGRGGDQGMGGLGDILGKMMGGGQGQQAAAPRDSGRGGDGGLGDILGKLGGAGQSRSSQQSSGQPSADQQGGGGIEDMLRKLQGQLGGQGGSGQGGGGQGGLMDILSQVLGQATSGVRDGARKVDDMTGASGRMKDATGQSPDDLMAKLKELIAQNQVGAGAAAGGLGAVVLGTKTGRVLAGKAMKLGGLALIGGLAYKALQNYQGGKPLITGASEVAIAPQGSGFEPAAVSNDAALLYVRGMIAAAAADGRIDATEQQKILGGLKQAGLDAQAEEFLANELNKPASAEELASQVRSQEEAVQLFTAARVSIELDTQEEHDFLVALAQNLGLDGNLASHIDAAARSAA